MEERLPLEYAALGLLMRGPQHGYQLHHDFQRCFGPIWHCGRSQFYAALKALESAGLAASSLMPQEGRPPRHILHITPAGRQAFLEWLNTPVRSVRQMRVEFLSKLRLFDLLGLPGAPALIEAQLAVCDERLARLETARKAGGSDDFDELVYTFRKGQLEAVRSWLEQCRRRYT
ncbi:MAG: helix-turn-helix transcriptional regulator [Anaerolineae bacterium]